MNIKELCKTENINLEKYKDEVKLINFCMKKLTSLEGLPDDFNTGLNLYKNKLKNLKGLSKNFNQFIILNENQIEGLDGLNDVLDPRKILGLDEKFIIKEYRRLGKSFLLI